MTFNERFGVYSVHALVDDPTMNSHNNPVRQVL